MTEESNAIRVKALEDKVVSLEKWQSSVITRDAVAKVDRQHMDKRFDAVEKRLDASDANAKNFFKLSAGAIIRAVVAWVLNGGLAGGGPV